MVLDKNDPKKVLSMSIFIEGDDAPVKTPTEIHQPDNIESTPQGLLITEDPGRVSSSSRPRPNATTARLMRYTFATNVLDIAARVDQSLDENTGSPGVPSDKDATPVPGLLGAWESSGVIDASPYFGLGAFLVTVQASTYWVDKAPDHPRRLPAVRRPRLHAQAERWLSSCCCVSPAGEAPARIDD